MKIKGIEAALTVLLLLYIVWICTKDQVADIPMNTIEVSMHSQESLNELQKQNLSTLKKFYGLDGSLYEEYLFYKSEDAMSVDELLIIKVKTEDQLEEAENAIEERTAEQKQSFDGYGTEQMALLNQSIMNVRGNYIFFGVSEHTGEWEKTFLSLIMK